MDEKKLPRALRNCNPLNIRHSNSMWQGLCREQMDKEFCQFKSMVFGWRAAFKLLTRTYYHVYRLYTIERIITRWAPPTENDTEAYIKRVSELTGFDPKYPLGLPSDPACGFNWICLGLAMAYVETGTRNLDFFEALAGWKLARKDISYS